MGSSIEYSNVIPLDGRDALRGSQRGWALAASSRASRFGSSAAVHAFAESSDSWETAGTNEGFPGSIGSSAPFLAVLDQIRAVAPTSSTVLLEGETGTGKELIARAVHSHSDRRRNAFVTMNCAAIPAGLLESELFGHERGAFTGAVTRRTGRFEAADHGTLFLDEIGEMPLELQAKLLRVLQEREIERLGGTHTQRVDVRVVAATNQKLMTLVSENRFRSDLYYRLSVFPISIPALRSRREDIPLLVSHFVRTFAERMSKPVPKIAPETMDRLVRHSWPGNIRELQNTVERAMILTRGPALEVPPFPTAPAARLEPVTLEDAERAHIREALEKTNWVVGGTRGAAARLGMKRTTLMSKIDRLGMQKRGDVQ